MSVSPIITHGFGTYGGVNFIPIYGFDYTNIPAFIASSADIELTCQITTTVSFTVLVENDISYTVDLSNE